MNELQELMNRVRVARFQFGLALNASKTKIMKICRFGNQIINEREFITLNDNEKIENVREIVYLGSSIMDNYDDTKEIKRRLCIARNAMVLLTKI